MSNQSDRQFTKDYVVKLLEGVRGKTLGDVDSSRQFDRTINSDKITGIAGDVVEQSIFGYKRDSKQECDIIIDGVSVELKTTGVRIPKKEQQIVRNLKVTEYNKHLCAKEGISVTAVTFEPKLDLEFMTSHFWQKAERMLIVLYEYKSYEVVPASMYKEFPIIDYCFNTFSDSERDQLRNDWEIVRDYLVGIYNQYADRIDRIDHLEGFTHLLRPNLLLIELVPGFKKRVSGQNVSYQHPRYRLKQTFVDHIVHSHFARRADEEVSLQKSFNSFAELDEQCHRLTKLYGNHTFEMLKDELGITCDIATTKDFGAKCILKMFGADCKRLNQISDFTKAGIIAKTITLDAKGKGTEDMKLTSVDFDELTDRNVDFEESEMYSYFCEHSFLFPIFIEVDNTNPLKTYFAGFKRFAFDEDFLYNEVKRTWEDARHLIHSNKLEWVYDLDKNGNRIKNKSGSYKGAPNLPKSSDYAVFFRGGGNDSRDEFRTERVNNVSMMPQFLWLKRKYTANKLNTLNFL